MKTDEYPIRANVVGPEILPGGREPVSIIFLPKHPHTDTGGNMAVEFLNLAIVVRALNRVCSAWYNIGGGTHI